MYTKLLAASVLTIGLATSAMAQSSEGAYSNHHNWFGNEQYSGGDHNTTGSVNVYRSGLESCCNSGSTGLRASNPAVR